MRLYYLIELGEGGSCLFPDLDKIVEQILSFLETLLNEIMRFIEQNVDIIEKVIQAINDFIAWLQGLVTF